MAKAYGSLFVGLGFLRYGFDGIAQGTGDVFRARYDSDVAALAIVGVGAVGRAGPGDSLAVCALIVAGYRRDDRGCGDPKRTVGVLKHGNAWPPTVSVPKGREALRVGRHQPSDVAYAREIVVVDGLTDDIPARCSAEGAGVADLCAVDWCVDRGDPDIGITRVATDVDRRIEERARENCSIAIVDLGSGTSHRDVRP